MAGRPSVKLGLMVVALAVLIGCAMSRHRAQVRQGLLTRGLHREAFLREWGPPTRTFSLPGPDPVFRAHPFGGSWERPIYEVWEYAPRATCLTFDGVRLIAWETGRNDCEPKPSREGAEGKGSRRPPPPLPPYPSNP